MVLEINFLFGFLVFYITGSFSKFRESENGVLYFIKDKLQLFRVNKRSKTVEEVEPDSFGDLPGLNAWFSKLEFLPKNDGDGFRVMTNEGEQLFLFPIIRKVYSKDEWYKARSGFESIPVDATVHTSFRFSSYSHYYSDEKIQLVKYVYKSPIGYLKTTPRFMWDRNYGWSGIFIDADPYNKEFISRCNMQNARILSYGDFTLDRQYFSASTLDYNEQSILVGLKTAPAKNETYSAQLMDVKTGEIRWTYPIPRKKNTSQVVDRSQYPVVGWGMCLWKKMGNSSTGLKCRTKNKAISIFNVFKN